MGKNLKIINSELQTENTGLKIKIEELKNDLSSEKDRYNQLTNESDEKYKSLQTDHDIEKGLLNSNLDDKDVLLKEKDAQLDLQQTKKLASAYDSQEVVYKNEANFWAWWVLGTVASLALATVIAVCVSHEKVWYDKFEYYVIDLVLLTALWFVSSQYTDSIRLRNDYANRKTLAQSFNNILNNLQEDGDIKPQFIGKTTDILCAPVTVSKKDPILSKEVWKQITEIIKSAKNI